MPKARPKHLNLFVIKQPIPAIMSILHRVSGVFLFLLLAVMLWLLQSSLASPESFERMHAAVSHPLMKLVLIVMAWAYLHHLFAGLRHLFFDMHIGGELRVARASAATVMIASLVLTAVAAVAIW